MPVFEYSALNVKGKTIRGVLDADSVRSVRNKLKALRIYPVSIVETRQKLESQTRSRFFLGRLFERSRPVEVALFTRQLATLIGAGFPLVSAIDTMLPQIESHGFKKKLTHIKNMIVEGSPFATALGQYPEAFSALYVNMIRAGETAGTLDVVLNQLAELAEKQMAMRNRVRTAMVYPVFMTLLGSAILYFLLTYVVPNITAIFTDMDQVLPAPTRVLIVLSDFFKTRGWTVLVALVVVVIALRNLLRIKKVRYRVDRLTLALPVLGTLARKLAVSRFARTLASLLENGVTLLVALEIVQNIVGNMLIAERVETAITEVGKGVGLGVSLAEGELFPHLAVQMVQVGEQSGELEAMLYKIADVYEMEVEASLMRLTALMEPLLILVMGVIVLFIVVSICLPLFEMNQLVR